MPMTSRGHGPIASIEEVISDARNGRIAILINDGDPQNEGHLVIPAQFCTPQTIAFMAVNGRGLICLSLTEQRARELGLAPMVGSNRTRHGRAFTTSIEAKHGIDTGISAADRARTIATAIDAANGRDAIVTPGHVFPLIARDGGVLVRAGHTEAAVDIAQLAGLNRSGVLCEIANDDGTMARLDDLVRFGMRHDIKIGTVRDLIAYRLRHDNLIERIGEQDFTSRWGGQWKAISYRNRLDGSEALAIVRGRINPTDSILVRMHSADLFADALGGDGGQPSPIERAMRVIANAPAGVLVLLGSGFQDTDGADQAAEPQFQDYGIGAQILADLGVHRITLLARAHRVPVGLDAYGLTIVEERDF